MDSVFSKDLGEYGDFTVVGDNINEKVLILSKNHNFTIFRDDSGGVSFQLDSQKRVKEDRAFCGKFYEDKGKINILVTVDDELTDSSEKKLVKDILDAIKSSKILLESKLKYSFGKSNFDGSYNKIVKSKNMNVDKKENLSNQEAFKSGRKVGIDESNKVAKELAIKYKDEISILIEQIKSSFNLNSEIENNKKGLKIVAIDETKNWKDNVIEKTGRAYGFYLYDENKKYDEGYKLEFLYNDFQNPLRSQIEKTKYLDEIADILSITTDKSINDIFWTLAEEQMEEGRLNGEEGSVQWRIDNYIEEFERKIERDNSANLEGGKYYNCNEIDNINSVFKISLNADLALSLDNSQTEEEYKENIEEAKKYLFENRIFNTSNFNQIQEKTELLSEKKFGENIVISKDELKNTLMKDLLTNSIYLGVIKINDEKYKSILALYKETTKIDYPSIYNSATIGDDLKLEELPTFNEILQKILTVENDDKIDDDLMSDLKKIAREKYEEKLHKIPYDELERLYDSEFPKENSKTMENADKIVNGLNNLENMLSDIENIENVATELISKEYVDKDFLSKFGTAIFSNYAMEKYMGTRSDDFLVIDEFVNNNVKAHCENKDYGIFIDINDLKYSNDLTDSQIIGDRYIDLVAKKLLEFDCLVMRGGKGSDEFFSMLSKNSKHSPQDVIDYFKSDEFDKDMKEYIFNDSSIKLNESSIEKINNFKFSCSGGFSVYNREKYQGKELMEKTIQEANSMEKLDKALYTLTYGSSRNNFQIANKNLNELSKESIDSNRDEIIDLANKWNKISSEPTLKDDVLNSIDIILKDEGFNKVSSHQKM